MVPASDWPPPPARRASMAGASRPRAHPGLERPSPSPFRTCSVPAPEQRAAFGAPPPAQRARRRADPHACAPLLAQHLPLGRAPSPLRARRKPSRWRARAARADHVVDGLPAIDGWAALECLKQDRRPAPSRWSSSPSTTTGDAALALSAAAHLVKPVAAMQCDVLRSVGSCPRASPLAGARGWPR